jgi:hypothetical protein
MPDYRELIDQAIQNRRNAPEAAKGAVLPELRKQFTDKLDNQLYSFVEDLVRVFVSFPNGVEPSDVPVDDLIAQVQDLALSVASYNVVNSGVVINLRESLKVPSNE